MEMKAENTVSNTVRNLLNDMIVLKRSLESEHCDVLYGHLCDVNVECLIVSSIDCWLRCSRLVFQF